MTMKPLTLADIARVTNGTYVGDKQAENKTITGVVRDNREVKNGNLFLCIQGARVDGHSFADAAFAAGAACCLAEKPLEAPAGPYILVDSTLSALQSLAAYYRSLFQIPVIGVIGSVGKTSTKEMTAAVLSQKYNVLKTPENLNNEIGVPLTLLSLREEHEAAIVEMGISDFGEMSRLGNMVRPDICLMTNIGYCHLEQLGNLNGVLKAKSEVFQYMGQDAVAIMNGDDELLRAYDPGIQKITYGYSAGTDFTVSNVENRGLDGISCEVTKGGQSFSLSIPAFGSHMVLAALAAVATGFTLGLDVEAIQAGINSYQPVGGRANVMDTGYITIINDCYNANPNSVTAALLSLSQTKGRKVAILGDMFELGAQAADMHREIGVFAAQQNIDSVICCGKLAESIYKGLIFGQTPGEAWHFPMKEAFFSTLPSLIKKGDIVLVKASHGMHFEEIVDELKALS